MSDPQKRAIYDQYGEEGLKGQVPPPPSSAASGGSSTFRFNPRNADDIFSEFFGFSSPFGGDHMGGGASQFPRGMFRGGSDSMPPSSRKGAAIERTLPCSLEDLYKGTTKKMKISRDATDATG